MKDKVYYVTFHQPKISLGTLYSDNKTAIKCDSEEDMLDIAHDVYSLDGVTYLRLNKCGKIRKGYLVFSSSDYRNNKRIILK